MCVLFISELFLKAFAGTFAWPEHENADTNGKSKPIQHHRNCAVNGAHISSIFIMVNSVLLTTLTFKFLFFFCSHSPIISKEENQNFIRISNFLLLYWRFYILCSWFRINEAEWTRMWERNKIHQKQHNIIFPKIEYQMQSRRKSDNRTGKLKIETSPLQHTVWWAC